MNQDTNMFTGPSKSHCYQLNLLPVLRYSILIIINEAFMGCLVQSLSLRIKIVLFNSSFQISVISVNQLNLL